MKIETIKKYAELSGCPDSIVEDSFYTAKQNLPDDMTIEYYWQAMASFLCSFWKSGFSLGKHECIDEIIFILQNKLKGE